MRKPFTFILAAALMFLAAGITGADDVTVKPYGFILTNVQYNNNKAFDIPIITTLTDTTANFLITPRQSRFGLKFGYEEQEWKFTGNIELDFWGLKGSGNNGAAMQSAPRLRRAYVKMTKDKISLLFGQEWIVFAPLSPPSDAHVSIPAMTYAGNLWNRLPQVRFEYKNPMDKNLMLLQVALVRPIGSDQTPTYGQGDLFGAGEVNGLPFVQGRLGMTFDQMLTLGVSGHFGQEDFKKLENDITYREKTGTYAFAVDARVAKEGVTFMAEGFMGANIHTLFSKATYFDKTLTNGRKNEPLKAVGGWGSIGYSVPNTSAPVSVNGGLGMEILDGDDTDSLAVSGLTQESKNMALFGNIFYSPVSKLRMGLEVYFIKTTYKASPTPPAIVEADADNVTVNFSTKFSF